MPSLYSYNMQSSSLIVKKLKLQKATQFQVEYNFELILVKCYTFPQPQTHYLKLIIYTQTIGIYSLIQRCRKDFLVGGGQYVFVVQDI